MNKKIITDITKLKLKSNRVNIADITSIVKDLEDSLDTKKGIGLTAIQIGIKLQVAIIKIPNKELITLYNSKIIEKENPFQMSERCLSLSGIQVITRRYKNIIWVNGDGKKYESSGIEAVCIQHEIDHFKGILIIDRKWRKK